MKAARDLERGRCEVHAFLKNCSSALTVAEMSLDYTVWTNVIDGVEKAARDPTVLPDMSSITSSGRQSALQHYHNVYHTAADLVPLSQTQWLAWLTGVSHLFSPPTTDTALEDLRAELRREYRGAYEQAWWGSLAVVQSKLDMFFRHVAGSASVDISCLEERDPDKELSASYAPVMQKFNRLALDAQHLYGEYATIGQKERSYWSDTVMNSTNDMQVESIIRQTFKRDFAIPSILLAGALAAEYEDFEVDEKKKTVISAIRTRTLSSSISTVAEKLYAHECSLLEKTEYPMMTWDKQANNLADELVRVLRNDGSQDAMFRGMALSMQRILEKEAFPAFVNPSRIEFTLSLLQRWLWTYMSHKHHRDPGAAFASDNDDSLWQFVVDRHDLLLRWGLSCVIGSCENSKDADATERRLEADRASAAQLTVLRTVSCSLVHCWQSYLCLHDGKSEKVKSCRSHVTEVTRTWVRRRLVDHFGRACRLAIYDRYTAITDERNTTAMTVASLASEANLYIFLCHMMLTVCSDQETHRDIRRRLRPLFEELITFAREMPCPVVHACQRVLATLERTRDRSPSGKDEERDFTAYLEKNWVVLMKASSLTRDHQLMECIEDKYLESITSCGASLDGQCLRYEHTPRPRPGGLLMNFACEVRRAYKEVSTERKDEVQQATQESA